MVIIKGTNVRLGLFKRTEVVLKKGNDFYLTTDNKLCGNENIVSINQEHFVKEIDVGDKIFIDYGDISLTVEKIEEVEEKHLIKLAGSFEDCLTPTTMEQQMEGKFREKKNSLYFHKLSNLEKDEQDKISEEADENSNSECGEHQHIEGGKNVDFSVFNKSPVHMMSPEKKFVKQSYSSDKFKKRVENSGYDKIFKQQSTKKQKKKLLIKCTVDHDCTVRSGKPIFVYKSKNMNQNLELIELCKKESCVSDGGNSEDDTEYESCLTIKDINDFNHALIQDADFIVIPYVQRKNEIIEAKTMLNNSGKENTKIISIIQNDTGAKHFDEILEHSDAIMIARGFLAARVPLEKLWHWQREMIRKCHKKKKQIFLSTQILESMVSSFIPSCSEIGEISNLILESVDGFLFTSETSFGPYGKECVETICRIIYETQFRQVLELMENPIMTPLKDIDRSDKSGRTIEDTIAYCSVNAMYMLNATLIVVVSESGFTCINLSKMRTTCPILFVTNNKTVARNLRLLSKTTTAIIKELNNPTILQEEVLQVIRKRELAHEGDIIIMSSGDQDFRNNSTNCIRIIKF